MYGGRYLYPILTKILMFQQNVVKHCNIKFDENPFNGSGVVKCGHTDSHCEATRRIFLQLLVLNAAEKRWHPYLVWDSDQRPHRSIRAVTVIDI
jgi:hypothetical protein